MIEGFSKYMITEEGKIISLYKNIVMATFKGTDGSEVLVLVNDAGHKKPVKVHRLMAKTFLLNPENKPEVNHIDGNRMNNNLSNLEWVTRSENERHAWRTGLKEKHRETLRERGRIICQTLSKRFGYKRRKPIYQFGLDGNCLAEYDSPISAKEVTGIKCIINAANGYQKTAGGFIWKYK